MTRISTRGIARRWDAGEAGCGKLIVGLRREINRIEAGERLEVAANDPAAFIDLAAWCEMTGNILVAEHPPTYVIQRNND